jgi:tripartite ATP-independent transporter DctM subunit
LIMAFLLMVGIFMISKRRGFPKFKFAGITEIWRSFGKALPGLMAPVILIGGMLLGIFTPTEAATVAVLYAITVGFILKSLTFKELWQALKKSALDSAAMMYMFLGATLVGLLVTRLHLAEGAVHFISGVTTSPVVLLMIINILLLIAGCLLDPICSLLLFTPVLVPVTQSFGINEVHFGIVMILNLMIGQITPPMGTTTFIVCKIAGVKLIDFLKEAYPLLILLVIALLTVTYVPQTVLWLPSLFMK